MLNVVPGFGEEAGEALVRHPLVRGITFTGSVETGPRIYRGAAQGLKPVVLELGGKNPVLVFDDADLDRPPRGARRRLRQFRPGLLGLLAVPAASRRSATNSSSGWPRARTNHRRPGLDDRDIGPLVSDEQY